MKKRLLITGSAGFVGSHTAKWILQTTDWEVIGLDSFRHLGDAERVSADPRYSMICHDLNAPISRRTDGRIGHIDYVINCSSISHVDTSISDPVHVWENNTRLIGNILEWARFRPAIEKFIHCSTDEVFGSAYGDHCHHEWDVIAPSNPYAASKAAQDALAFAYWRTYDMPIAVTHTMNMIGTMQDPEKYLPKMISRIHRGETVEVHGNEREIGSRMYIDCRNLADAWRWMLEEQEFAKYSSGEQRMTKFNIAGLEEITNLELAIRVADLMDKPLKYSLVDFHKTRAGHDLRYALDSSKLIAAGWKAPIPLDQTLRETIEHVTSNPSWQE